MPTYEMKNPLKNSEYKAGAQAMKILIDLPYGNSLNFKNN
jgi:hypothetical protein